VYALGTFFGGAEGSEQRINIERTICTSLSVIEIDLSPAVRKELVIAFAKYIKCYEKQFKDLVTDIIEEGKPKDLERKRALAKTRKSDEPLDISASQGTVYGMLWKILAEQLAADPFAEISRMAEGVVKSIMDQIAPQPPTLSAAPPPSPDKNKPKSKLKRSLASFRSSPNLARLAVQSATLPSPQTTTPTSPASSQTPLKKTISFEGVRGGNESEEDTSGSPAGSADEIVSSFYDWSCEYFSKPILSLRDFDETTPTWSEKRWKQQRNDSILVDAKSLQSGKKYIMITPG
jgi:hypothetical protein